MTFFSAPEELSVSHPTIGTRKEDREGIDFIVRLIYDRTRIRLHSGKEPLIRARLGKRQRALGMTSLSAYADYLCNSGDEEEITHAVDSLTTNFTHFLREEDHFRFMVETALPQMSMETRTIRIWSAACATGEEPYSMAFYLEEHFPMVAGWDWRVLASDVSTRALAKAKQGIFTEERVRPVSPAWQRKYFKRGFGSSTGLYRVKQHICDRMEFRLENLLNPAPARERFQLIFCRNVMIYFDRATQERVVQNLCEALAPKGYLLIGHSESLTGMKLPLRCLRPSYYQLT